MLWRNKMRIRIALILLALTACNPIIKRVPHLDYKGSDPSCISGCNLKKSECRVQQANSATYCRMQDQAEYDSCMAERSCWYNYLIHQRECEAKFCPRRNCSPDYELCENFYMTCAIGCGATTYTKVECVKFCSDQQRVAEAIKRFNEEN